MKLTKTEKQLIELWRLARDVSAKNDNGYYDVTVPREGDSKKFYLPQKGHMEFGSFDEAKRRLESFLKMDEAEYRYSYEQMIEKKQKLVREKKELLKNIKELEKGIALALDKMEASNEK